MLGLHVLTRTMTFWRRAAQIADLKQRNHKISAAHRQNVTVLQCNIIFCDICCLDLRVGVCRP